MKLSICIALLLLCCEIGNAQRADWRATFVPIDPWRALDGQTNYVKLDGIQFCGQIVEIIPQGVRIEGEWGPIGTVYYPVNGWSYTATPPQYADFFVANYPYRTYPGEIIPSVERLMAWHTGNYTYNTVSGGTRTIGKLDYGVPCGPNPVLLAAMKRQREEVEEKRRESELRTMEMLQREATNGDSSAAYSLGFHYLHGIGCDTNQVMGIFWLLKAEQEGNLNASNDLQDIESPPASISTNRPNLPP